MTERAGTTQLHLQCSWIAAGTTQLHLQCSLDLILRNKSIIRRTSLNMTTLFQTGAKKRLAEVEMKSGVRKWQAR